MKTDVLDHRIDMFIKPLDRLQISTQIQRQKLEEPTRCGADCGWACLLPQQGRRKAASWGYNPSGPPWTSPAPETPASLLPVRCFGEESFLLLGIGVMESPGGRVLKWEHKEFSDGEWRYKISVLCKYLISYKSLKLSVFAGCKCSSTFLDQMSIPQGTGLLQRFCTIPIQKRLL